MALHFTYPTPASELAQEIDDEGRAALGQYPQFAEPIREHLAGLRALLAEAAASERLRPQALPGEVIIRPVTVLKIRLRLQHLVETVMRTQRHASILKHPPMN